MTQKRERETNTEIIKSSICIDLAMHLKNKKTRKTDSCFQQHTQNVSAHNYVLELNNITTVHLNDKRQILNKVGVSVLFPSISFS